MAIKGFDSNYFVQALFEYAQENYPAWAAGKDADDLQAAIVEWYPEAETFKAAAEAAYVDLGVPFGIAPNGYFDVAEYRLAWAKVQTQIKLVTEAQALEAYDAELAGETYNGDAYAHYLAKGAALGVNPSNDFDDSEYLQNLIDGLGIDTTVAELRALGIENDLIGLELFVDYPEFQDEYPAVPVTGDELVNVTPPAPTTVELTEETDVLSANIFNAGLVYTPGGDDRINALQDEDILTGTGELPTLNATLGNANDNGAIIITPELNNIDIVNVAFTGSGAAVQALDMQDADSLNSVNITRVSSASNTARIENIKQVLENMSVADTNANQGGVVEFSYGAGVLRGANTGFLNLDNVQVGYLNVGRDISGVNAPVAVPPPAVPVVGVGIEGYENLTIDSSGSANSIGTLTTPMDTGVDGKIIVTGDTNLTLGSGAAVANIQGQAEAQVFGGGIVGPQGRINAVDASQLEGALTLAVGAGFAGVGGATILSTGKADTSGQVQNVTITGTVNDDTFYLQDVVQAGDVLAGGEGTDTAVIYANNNLGIMSSIENVSVQINGFAAGNIDLDFDQIAGATNIAVRNITYNNILDVAGNIVNRVSGDDGANQLVNLYDLTAAQAGAIGIAHSTTGNNGIADTTLNATLKTSTATDIMAVSINEGVNLDPRFNFTLNNLPLNAALGQVIETLVIKDADTESNSVALNNIANYVGSIDVGTTEAAGLAGTFINFDSGAARAAALVGNASVGQVAGSFDQRGGYRLDVDGQANDFSSVGTAGAIAAADVDRAVNTTAGLTANARYNTLDNGAAGDARITAQAFNAAAETSDVIARFGDVTRSNGVSSQDITGGAGNDTFIFDDQGVKSAGYSSADTVKGGTGLDTLVLDGNTAATISMQKSEWDNTSGIDVLRLAGNQGVAIGFDPAGVANVLPGTAVIGSDVDSVGYYIEIDNEFVKQTDSGNNLKIVSNDGDLSTNLESDLILNLRTLEQTSNVAFVGANGNVLGGAIASNRVIVGDKSANASNFFDGGDTVVDGSEGFVPGTTLRVSSSNNNVLEVYNEAQVTINDLANTKNFARIEGSNDTAAAQSLTLILNDTVVDQLVDAGTAARAVNNIETLTIAANSNINTVGGVTTINAENLKLDAAALTNKFALNVVTGANSANTIATGAGADDVVLLGNYTTVAYAGVNEYGVSIAANANNTVGARVVTDNINLGGGADTLTTYGAVNLAGATLAGVETIDANSALVLTATQFNALTRINFQGNMAHQLTIIDDIAGANTVDLNKVILEAGTLIYDVQTNGTSGEVRADINGTASTQDIAGVVGTNPTNGANNASTPTNITGAGTYTGTPGVNDNFTTTIANLGAATAITGTAADNETLTITDTGAVVIPGTVTNVVIPGTVTNIDNLVLQAGNNAVTFAATTSGIRNVTGSAAADSVDLTGLAAAGVATNVNLGDGAVVQTLTLGAQNYTANFLAGAGATDKIVFVDGTNIAGANVTGFEDATFVGANTLTVNQYNGFTGVIAAAGGADALTFTTAGNFVIDGAIETYTLAAGTNNITGTDIDASTSQIVGGTGTDTFTFTTPVAAALDLSASAVGQNWSGIETLNLNFGSGLNMVTMFDGAGTTVNALAGSTVELGTGGQTFVSSGAGNNTVTGNTGVDTYTFNSTGADIIDATVAATRSNITSIDTVYNFKSAGADQFNTGTGATTLSNLTIATADTNTLAAAIQTAATAAGDALAVTTQAYVITVNGGTAAGTYAFYNMGTSAATVDDADFLIQLMGTTGTILAADFA